jgi:hypothetical protein
MNKQNLPLYIIIGALVVLLFLMQQCGGVLGIFGIDRFQPQEPIIETDTVRYETIRKDTFVKYEFVPQYVYIDVPRVDTIIRNLTPSQSLEDLRDYYSVKIFKDTLSGEYYQVIITDTLEQNALAGRNVWAKVTERITVVEKTITLPPTRRFKMYGNVGLSGAEDAFDAIVGLTFVPKNDRFMYTVNYGILQKRVDLTFHYKIGGKKY